MEQAPDITRYLLAYDAGDRVALDRLFPVVYEQLRGIAHARLRHERPGQTLCTTGLVHEAYLKLVDLDRVQWKDRQHFFAIASRAMRQVIIDAARVRRAAKRGGGVTDVTLDEDLWIPDDQADRLIELDEALEHLAAVYPRVAEVFTHRYFSGFTNEETAQVLDVSVPTIERDLHFGRTWLAKFLSERRSVILVSVEDHA